MDSAKPPPGTTSRVCMNRTFPFFRLLALPACMVWGIREFIALQRARLLSPRPPQHLGR